MVLMLFTLFGLADLPDECNFSLRLAGASHLFWSTAPVYEYLEWLHNNANGSHVEESYRVYRRHLQMIQAQHPEKRLVLKCPSHALHLQTLSKVIPESNIIFTHRDPSVLAASEASLITRLQATSVTSFDFERAVQSNLMKNINYSKNMVEYVMQDPAPKVFHSPYCRLVSTPKELVQDIHEFFDLPSVPDWNQLEGYRNVPCNTILADTSNGYCSGGLLCVAGCDNGGGFKLSLEELCENMSIRPKPAASHDPQGNLILERVHQVVGNCIRMFDASKKKEQLRLNQQ